MEEMKKLSASRKRSIESLEAGEALSFDVKDLGGFELYFIAKCTYGELAKKYLKNEPLAVKVFDKMNIVHEQVAESLDANELANTVKFNLVRASNKIVQILPFDSLEDEHIVKGSRSAFGIFGPVVLSSKQKKISVEDMCNMIDEYVGE